MAKKINKKLQREIFKMAYEDQLVLAERGRQGKVNIERFEKTRHKNTARLKNIIKKHGWPTRSLVGSRASSLAWLIAQHSDHDIGFQKKALKLIQNAADRGEASRSDVAYLTDRILVHEGKKQLYGTQFRAIGKKRLGPQPIKDRKNLDKRRAKMNLGPFKEYERQMLNPPPKQKREYVSQHFKKWLKRGIAKPREDNIKIDFVIDEDYLIQHVLSTSTKYFEKNGTET